MTPASTSSASNSTVAAYPPFDPEASRSYVVPPEVADIVNLAIHLSRPLLVEGEAGCGKTSLATAIAEGLGLADDAVVSATVKSTSQAKDLLYRFDALRRLQDAQDPQNTTAHHVYPYIHLQPLGKAIASGRPCLMLIDEIDKADLDFPNDLLDVFDRFQFEIEDLPEEESERCEAEKGFGRQVRAKPDGVPPIVLITSNREKPLPEPFLRRCLYLQLTFPSDPALLARIVQRNLSRSAEQIQDSLIHHAVREFIAVRERSEECGLQKPPSTSELVDWVRALHWQQREERDVSASNLRPADQAILLKLQRDLETFLRSPVAEEPG
ncbi:MAG: AAA family ATPase [Cyanobium sp.]